MTRGAKRTLETLSGQMLAFLAERPFEEITVGQLCEAAQYPRATFYNYFDDKYDLLNYCWLSLAEKIGLSEYHHAAENEMLYVYFDRIFDFTRENAEAIRQVLSNNGELGYMLSSLRNFLGAQMRRIFRDCPEAEKKEIPNELLADHYSSTLFLVWQWITLREGGCSKERAHGYLRLLIGRPKSCKCGKKSDFKTDS